MLFVTTTSDQTNMAVYEWCVISGERELKTCFFYDYIFYITYLKQTDLVIKKRNTE